MLFARIPSYIFGMIPGLETDPQFWRLAAGLGLFLFGMHQLEQSLKTLAGRPFKVFLRDHTARPVKAVLAGVAATAALQSSSVVSLIVLAFVGTGIITLASAIGIAFGSNLGTTVTGWIVATIGFRFDIERLALPLVAVGGLLVVWSRPGSRRAGTGYLIAGVGLMLIGLGFMKDGAIGVTELLDPATLTAYPLIVFLLAGLFVTALIQSSSATIMIALSALYAGAISLQSAAALVIGADLGTNITAILGALAGSMDKRRVATALVLFNVVTNSLAFLSLRPLLQVVTGVIGVSDPLYALVAFHSLFNLLGILIFLPLTGWLSRWLANKFVEPGIDVLRHIKESDLAVPGAAIENLCRETLRLIDQAAALNQLDLGLAIAMPFYEAGEDRSGVALFARYPDLDKGYDSVKQLEGEILAYATRLQELRLDAEESERLGQVIVAIRSAVHAAKALRDTRHDMRMFRDSVDDPFNAWYGQFRDAGRDFYGCLAELRSAGSAAHRFELLVELKRRNETLHRDLHAGIVREVSQGRLSKLQISTLLNVNRELYLSNQSLLAALADALLDVRGAADFESIPAGS